MDRETFKLTSRSTEINKQLENLQDLAHEFDDSKNGLKPLHSVYSKIIYFKDPQRDQKS